MMKNWFRKHRKLNLNQQTHHELSKQVDAALDQIKQQSLPWVMLLGEHAAGKTSLLTHVKPTLRSSNNKTLTDNTPTKNIDWWYNDEAIFIDPAGRYCFCPASEENTFAYWSTFLSIIKQKNPKINRFCFVINASTLMYPDSSDFENLLATLETQLTLLLQHWPAISLNIIVTQCDYLSGFAEFFNNLSQEEQQQCFGFSLTNAEEGQFIKSFERFLKIVNQRLITRLHYEPNKHRRVRIHDFPLQLESLTSALAKLIRRIPDSSQLTVSNMFFCSSQQTTATINLLSNNFSKALQLNTHTEEPLVNDQHALFITDMMRQISRPCATATITKQTSKKNNGWQLLAYPAALGIAFAAILVFHSSYQKNIASINPVAKIISTASENKLLDRLNTLYAVKMQLNNNNTKTTLGFSTAKKLKNKANTAYTDYLSHQFLTYLNATLNNVIQQQRGNPLALYRSLKVYLMFSDKEHRDTNFITQWFTSYWQDIFADDKEKQQQLVRYLKQTLAINNLHWQQQNTLIKQARDALQQQSVAQLGFSMLRSNNPNTDITLRADNNISNVDFSDISFPAFYAVTSFSDIYNHQIPALSNTIMVKNDWVLGDKLTQATDPKQFTSELQKIYLSSYLATWQENLRKIRLTPTNNLTEQIAQLQLITDPNSPLWKIYQSALHAASVNEAIPNNSALQQLATYLDKIKQQPDQEKICYQQARLLFSAKRDDDVISNILLNSKHLAEPLRSWSTQIAQNSWSLILDNAATYLRSAWIKNILSVYDKQIKNRYPLDKKTNSDISINAFHKLFGPGGKAQDYFNQVAAFVDTNQQPWKWRVLNDQALPLPAEYLSALINASLIQKMFYSNNPMIPSLNFRLTPLNLADSTQRFVLNIGGQMLHYDKQNKQTINATWPGKDGNFVTMRFDNNHHKHNPTLTTTGPWAWLRMLDNASIDNGDNPQTFIVTFKLDKDSATYQLNADNPANPYNSEVLDALQRSLQATTDQEIYMKSHPHSLQVGS